MEALENEDIRTRALLTLAVTTGMRRGELVGLMWDDIDFDKQIITISRSVYKPKGEEQRIKATNQVERTIRRIALQNHSVLYMHSKAMRIRLRWNQNIRLLPCRFSPVHVHIYWSCQ